MSCTPLCIHAPLLCTPIGNAFQPCMSPEHAHPSRLAHPPPRACSSPGMHAPQSHMSPIHAHPQACMPPWACTLWVRMPPAMHASSPVDTMRCVQWACGTHPTGIRSCKRLHLICSWLIFTVCKCISCRQNQSNQPWRSNCLNLFDYFLDNINTVSAQPSDHLVANVPMYRMKGKILWRITWNRETWHNFYCPKVVTLYIEVSGEFVSH